MSVLTVSESAPISLTVNETGTPITLVVGGGGAISFLGLNDTPPSYAGLSGRYLVVSDAETGISFVQTDLSTLAAHVANFNNPHQTTLENARVAGDTFEGIFKIKEIGADPTVAETDVLGVYVTDTNGKKNLNLVSSDGLKQRVMRDLISTVRNTSGSTIPAGSVVYSTGSTGTAPNVALAQANSENTLPAIGITMEAIDHNAFGRIQRFGRTEFSFNTSTFSANDQLYVSPTVAGGLTNVRPTHPNMAQPVGVVVVVGVGNGSIFTDFTAFYNGHSDGTISDTWTFGSTITGSQILAKTSTQQRTATFPDKDGTVAFTSDLSGVSGLTVSLNSPASGEALVYNGTFFVNEAQRVFGGVVSIPTGSKIVTVNGLNLNFSPLFYSPTVIKPSGFGNFSVNLIDGTSDSNGFSVELGATPNSTGYKLGYFGVY